MPDKSINILIYKQGYFGNVVKFLLSLDEISYPFWPIHQPFDKTKPRTDYLNFDQIRWRYGSWEKFHNAFGGTSTRSHGVCADLDDFLNSNYQNLTIYGHPTDLDLFFQNNYYKIEKLKIKYLTTDLSQDYEIVIKDFLIQNNNWPYIKSQDLLLYKEMVERYKPYTINLDNFVTGTKNFLLELDKLNKVVELNPDINQALTVYRSWTKARKLNQYNFFKE